MPKYRDTSNKALGGNDDTTDLPYYSPGQQRRAELKELEELERYAAAVEALSEKTQPNSQAKTLEEIGDPPMDDDLVLGCWNGKRFVSWKEWRNQTPISKDNE